MGNKKDTALAAKAEETTALAQGFDYGEDAGSGWENTSQDDFTIPFLAIIQALSPQLDENEAQYIEGAKVGQLLNTASNELYDGEEGVEFVACLTEHKYIEWKNRQTDGGGFVGVRECDDPVVQDCKANQPFGKYSLAVEGGNPHDLVETFLIYGLIVQGDEVITPAVISFSSTKIKAYKAALTPLRQVKGRPPLFAFRLRVTSCNDKTAKGKFKNFRIVPANGDAVSSLIDPASVVFQAAKEFKDVVSQGKAKVDHSGSAKGEGKSEDDAPF